MPVSEEELRIRVLKEPEPVKTTEYPAWGYCRGDDGEIEGKIFVFDGPGYTLPAGYHKSPADVPKKRGRPRKTVEERVAERMADAEKPEADTDATGEEPEQPETEPEF